MHSSLRALAALVFVFAFSSGCSCGPGKCGPSTCMGCCDSSGTCQGGFLPERCGTAGAACATCSIGQSCSAGQCGIVSVGGGGGGSGSTGGGGGGIGTGGGGGGNINGFCANYASAYCDWGIRCGEFASAGRSDCVSFIEHALCDAELVGVAKGYDVFNGTSAQACANSFATLDCGVSDPTGTGACSLPLVSPASSTGQGCFSNSDCEVSSDACGGSGCNRTCQAAGGLGQPCPQSASCSNGLRCDVATNLCSNPHNLGEMCNPFGGSGECTVDARCDETSSTCVALPVSGPCYQGFTCASNAFCDFSTNPGNCQLKKSDGQTCVSGGCIDGFWCDFTANDTCQAQTGQGSSCPNGSDSCLSGFTCRNGTCQPLAPLGAACAFYSDCVSGLLCDPVLKTCVQFEGETAGQSCTDYHYCDYPNTCHGKVTNPDGGVGTPGTCGPPLVGDPCSSTFGQCPNQSFCVLADAGVGTCTTSTHGSPCEESTDCLTGDFCALDNSCRAQLTQGQGCDVDSNGECVAPLQCVASSADAGTCGQLGGPNAACFGSNACQFPYTCVSGSCVAAGHQGQPCFDGFICLAGLCQADAGVAGICSGQTAAVGDPCFFGTMCASGSCIDGVCAPSCP